MGCKFKKKFHAVILFVTVDLRTLCHTQNEVCYSLLVYQLQHA
jgi:hypothetical protein